MKDLVKYNENYHPIALDIYQNALMHNLYRDAEVRPAGFVIVPNFLQMVLTPTHFVSDRNEEDQFGITLIELPKGKRNHNPLVLLNGSS